ncbi:NAD(P)-dependent oxidoreductase [Cellulomonas humilata]|uniref:NAD(P)-dependent oxidoreductase n=1 Tax=Cellulomonas humilata TaxID=144055 RepID=A0A7Y6DXP9_9CELL|nr:NAD(P)-dependent oxidoreductase [Cellulomonas humilata]NUU17184.1 NAD(P)-dependent oxidoreductase [Cellulomonas humilata]
MPDVGFIGLGIMGLPMAGHILDGLQGSGSALVVCSTTAAKAQGLVERGAVWADGAGEVAARCDVVVVMVRDMPQVREVAQGLLAGAVGRLTVVVCSTVSPQDVRDLDAELSAASAGAVRVVDAPVSGGQQGAVAGTLSIMVGGPPELVDRPVSVLSAAGRPVHLGPLEAAVVAERAGLDVAQLLDLLQGGYAASTILADKADRYARKDYAVSGAAKFWIKDLAAYREEAEITGTRTVLADRLHDTFSELTAAGWGDEDSTVVQAWIEGRRPLT